MSIVVSRGYAWIADRDRVAHAVVARGRATRTLCGILPVDPRYAWPAATRCPECIARADGKVA